MTRGLQAQTAEIGGRDRGFGDIFEMAGFDKPAFGNTGFNEARSSIISQASG